MDISRLLVAYQLALNICLPTPYYDLTFQVYAKMVESYVLSWMCAPVTVQVLGLLTGTAVRDKRT